MEIYTIENLTNFGNMRLEEIKAKGRISAESKTYYFPGISTFINLKNGRMLCHRAFRADDNMDKRSVYTKLTDCDSVLAIQFWGVIDIICNKIKTIVAEVIYPHTSSHNHSVDEFSVSATDTYPELKAFIDKCVSNGMGHHNTFIQVKKFA